MKVCKIHYLGYDDYCPDCIVEERNDLLAACEALYAAMLEWSEDLSDINERARFALLEEARIAIAKAKGEDHE